MQANLHRFCVQHGAPHAPDHPGLSGHVCRPAQQHRHHVLQGVKLHIGKGVYPVDVLIIDEGNFDLVLGNSFF